MIRYCITNALWLHYKYALHRKCFSEAAFAHERKTVLFIQPGVASAWQRRRRTLTHANYSSSADPSHSRLRRSVRDDIWRGVSSLSSVRDDRIGASRSLH